MPEVAPAPHPAAPRRARRAGGPARGLRRRDEAASEVVGQILMFGILSMVLILSLLGFNAAKDGAEGRVAGLEAESMAQRVAGVYISASLFAEEHAEDAIEYERRVDLPQAVQQRSYTVAINQETLVLRVDALGVEVSASLLSAGAPPGLVVCNQSGITGGPLLVKARAYDPDDPSDPTDPHDTALCPNGASGDIILFLESA